MTVRSSDIEELVKEGSQCRGRLPMDGSQEIDTAHDGLHALQELFVFRLHDVQFGGASLIAFGPIRSGQALEVVELTAEKVRVATDDQGAETRVHSIDHEGGRDVGPPVPRRVG